MSQPALPREHRAAPPRRPADGILLLVCLCCVAAGACGYEPAFEGLRSFRIAVAIVDPDGCLRLGPEDFERPIRAFFAQEGEALREMVSDDSEDHVAVILEAYPATSLGIRIGTYGMLRVQLTRRAVVRRTGEPASVPVWDDSVGYFLRIRDPALDALLAESRVLLRRLQRIMLQMPPIPTRTEAGIQEASRPCPPFRPAHVRFSVPVSDPDDILSFSGLEADFSVRRDLQQARPEFAARFSPLGDNALVVRIDCRRVDQDEVVYGIAGAVRCTFTEPVLVNRGRTCIPGMTWSSGLAFFADEPEQADLAARRYVEELLNRFADEPLALPPIPPKTAPPEEPVATAPPARSPPAP